MKSQNIQFILFLFILLLLNNPLTTQIVINEFMAANKSALFDNNQKTPDWIELYNNSDSEINLKNWSISDDENNPQKWIFPNIEIRPKSYLILFASGENQNDGEELHTNFKLDSDGEMLLLSNVSGEIVDYYSFGEQIENYSTGRLSDAYESWGVFSQSSPNDNNERGILAGESSVQIQFSHEAGIYAQPIELKIISDNTDIQIFYTLNGDTPTINDQIFEQKIQLTQDNVKPAEIAYVPTSQVWQAPKEVPVFHVIRARAFQNGVPVSKTFSRSFLINDLGENPHAFPIVSLILEQHNLFDFEEGIYHKGIDRNFNERGRDWERPVQIEYFEADFKLGFRQDLGMRISGNASRNLPQKSLKLYARDDYGDNRMHYPFFGEKYDSVFKKIKLRNLNGDRNGTGLTDDLAHEIIEGQINTDYSQRKFVIVYINGEYWGIHSLREAIDEYFIQNNQGIDKDEVSMGHDRKLWIDTVSGNLQPYFDLLDFAKNNDLKQTENYEYLCSKIDVDNVLDIFAAQTILANTDWPHHNNRFWQATNPETKWRWIFFDLDAAMKATDYDNFGFLFAPEIATAQFEEGFDFELINALMESPIFAEVFRNKMLRMLDTVFAPERTIPILEELIALVEPEMEAHILRWHYPNSIEDWHQKLGHTRDFLIRRPHYFSNDLINRMGDGLRVYPNPASEFLNIEIEMAENEEVSIEIQNSMGQIFQIGKRNLAAGTQLVEIEIPNFLVAGAYFLNLKTKRRNYIEKVILIGRN